MQNFKEWMAQEVFLYEEGVWQTALSYASQSAINIVKFIDKTSNFVHNTPAFAKATLEAISFLSKNKDLAQQLSANRESIFSAMAQLSQYDPDKILAETEKMSELARSVVSGLEDASLEKELLKTWTKSTTMGAWKAIVWFLEKLHITPTLAGIYGNFKELIPKAKTAILRPWDVTAVSSFILGSIGFMWIFTSALNFSGLLAKMLAFAGLYKWATISASAATAIWLLVLGVRWGKNKLKDDKMQFIIAIILVLTDPGVKDDEKEFLHKYIKAVFLKNKEARQWIMDYISKNDSLEESTIYSLYKSSVDAFPGTNKRQHVVDSIRIVELNWNPFIGMNTLFLKSRARSDSGKEYNPMILFKDVNYNESEVGIIANDGKQYSFQKLKFDRNEVLLRCNCQDFHWRFNYYDHVDRSLYGRKRKKYEAITNKSANPKEMPGMCKHLMSMSSMLKDSGVIE